jgi:hypothetical protein
MRPLALILLALAALGGCGSRGAPAGPDAGEIPTGSPASAPASAAPPARPAAPGRAGATDPNPLRLPPVRVSLDGCRRVFTFSEQMLAAAKPGSTLVLQAATVAGPDGDDLVIESRNGPSYKVHPGYVIAVPDEQRLKPGDPVITEHGGLLRHAVVTKFVRDRIGVRYTDLDGRAQEVLLPNASCKASTTGPSKAVRFVKQVDGLAPGNYAALRQGDEWLHVLLVSAFGEGESRRWFALGFGGAAMIVDAADLVPIPVKLNTKVGKIVWAKEGGKMRRATVQAIDDQGLLTVKFERAGRPSTVGWGLVMPPPKG